MFIFLLCSPALEIPLLHLKICSFVNHNGIVALNMSKSNPLSFIFGSFPANLLH
jgi:hypothetical protein